MGNIFSQPTVHAPAWMREGGGDGQMREVREIFNKLGVMGHLFWSGTTRRMRLLAAFLVIV